MPFIVWKYSRRDLQLVNCFLVGISIIIIFFKIMPTVLLLLKKLKDVELIYCLK